MKKHSLLLLTILLSGFTSLFAKEVSQDEATLLAQRFAKNQLQLSGQVQSVNLGVREGFGTSLYFYNIGSEGFVIVSGDDRFRPIVGYSDEGILDVDNLSPEFMFYMDKIIEARSSQQAVMLPEVASEWQSLRQEGRLLSHNGGKGVDYLVQTKWNQDSPYNFYSPDASSGPGGRCYAGCVATAMAQVMRFWCQPLQGTGSHSYYCGGYGQQFANFGLTYYDWDNMPLRITSNSPEEQIDAVATLIYHCGVSVDMGFSPTGSGASSWDVPDAIRRYFSYTNQAEYKNRDYYSLNNWQNMLKQQFDKGWPVYYSGYSNDGGHAFVCDGYDDNNLFHYNWGWGGSSDGWFVIDEIDFANWAGAIINYVPNDVYLYTVQAPSNLTVTTSGDSNFEATLSWTNPTQDLLNQALTSIDRIIVERDGVVILDDETATPGQAMTFTDRYMPTMVNYTVYAVYHGVNGNMASCNHVNLSPTCDWTFVMGGSNQGWNGGSLSIYNNSGVELGSLSLTSQSQTKTFAMPIGHTTIYWNAPAQNIENMSLTILDEDNNEVMHFEGSANELPKGLLLMCNNNCGQDDDWTSPHGLTLSHNNDDVILNWQGVSDDIYGYCIYRDGIMATICQEASFTDQHAGMSLHNYYVTALSAKGESDPSNEVCFNPEGQCDAPTGLTYTLTSAGKTKLSWNAPQTEGVSGYIIYRRTPGEEFKRIKLSSSTNYTDNATLPANRYEYVVTAYYSASECESSYASTLENPNLNYLEVNRTLIPSHLNSTEDGQSVTLTWHQATSASAYNIYRDGQLIASNITETTYTDSNVTAKDTYCYWVTGTTEKIESTPSNRTYIYGLDGLEENTAVLSIHPNPSNGIVTIEGNNLSEIVIFNLMGQKMRTIATSEEVTSVMLNLSDLPSGVYFIKANSSIEKLIIR